MTGDRGVSSPVSEILMVAIVVIVAATVGVFVFDLPARLTEPTEPRVLSDTRVVLGPETRSWAGGRNGSATRGEIDHVYVDYEGGQPFHGDDIGSIEVVWEGKNGDGGRLLFLNPSRFDEQSAQTYHDAAVGDFCTGEFTPGDRLTIRMVHNRWQDAGETEPSEVGVRYVESGWNDVSIDDGSAFFRVTNRYPVEYSGDRPIEPGDTVRVRFYGPDGKLLVAKTPPTTAKVYSGSVETIDDPTC